MIEKGVIIITQLAQFQHCKELIQVSEPVKTGNCSVQIVFRTDFVILFA